jgi:hypothetical protein
METWQWELNMASGQEDQESGNEAVAQGKGI